ncbi:MAG TPA: cation diffusion facilitator family transporter [Thermoanaerobaculia bacterium]|nr:cation diffusion facilitator family transporter [Thermoanaerobaculia bacterium]
MTAGRVAGAESAARTEPPARSTRFYAGLSIAAAIVTIALKLAAWRVTGSVGLLSDAAESLVNLAAALIALWALTVAARPADELHSYGYTKAEYFAGGAEGFLILAAAFGIAATAWERWRDPQPIADPGIGIAVAAAASILNGAVAAILMRAGNRLRSITLRADARHLLTDVWTSLGVIVGIALVAATGWRRLDPLIAFAVAVNIVWTGVRLVRETGMGLLDVSLPDADRREVASTLSEFQAQGILFHAIHTRAAGARRFVSMHVLVPRDWTVQRGHDLCEEVEAAIRRVLPQTTVFTHLEPREDPVSWDDRGLDRDPGP